MGRSERQTRCDHVTGWRNNALLRLVPAGHQQAVIGHPFQLLTALLGLFLLPLVLAILLSVLLASSPYDGSIDVLLSGHSGISLSHGIAVVIHAFKCSIPGPQQHLQSNPDLIYSFAHTVALGSVVVYGYSVLWVSGLGTHRTFI